MKMGKYAKIPFSIEKNNAGKTDSRSYRGFQWSSKLFLQSFCTNACDVVQSSIKHGKYIQKT